MLSFKRIYAILLRHLYLLKHSFSRWVDLVYWPTVDLLLWGFITIYLHRSGHTDLNLPSLFLGALIFWNILSRAQQGLAVGFLEDIWARNLLHLFVSPLSIVEYILGLILYSLLKALISAVVMGILSVYLFGFNFFDQGMGIIYLTLGLLIFAWSVGLLTMAFVLYFGQEAEILAWALGLLFLPFSAVFYPVSSLPESFQMIAKVVPPSYFFEAFRALILGKELKTDLLYFGYLLNLVYIFFSCLAFILAFQRSKKEGKIVKIGE